MGDVYNLVYMAKSKCSTATVNMSGMLRWQEVSWRHTGAINSRYEWIAQTLGFTFVDPNRWVDDWDFGRDGLPSQKPKRNKTPRSALLHSLWHRQRKTEDEE